MKKIVSDIARSKANGTLTPEQEAAYSILDESFEKAFAEEGIERKNQIDGIIAKLAEVESGAATAAVVRALAQKVDDVEANSRKSFTADESYRLKRALEGKKTEIMAVIREKGQAWGLEFKAKRAASAMMQTSTIVTGAVAINTDNVFDDLELTVIRYPANFVGDAINSRQVSKVPYSLKWKEQKAVSDGVVTTVAEGTTKPLVDFAFDWHYAYRLKYAGRIEFTEETEIDFEQLTMDVIDMFESEVLRAYNDGLLALILAWAPAYAGTALDGTIKNPNMMNVVKAGQLDVAMDNYTADVVFMNPADYAATQNMQNVNGDPIFIPDNVLFPGLRLFVTNKMTAGTILLGEGGIIKEQHGPFILRSGQYGTQFIENEKTIIGEIFSVVKLPTLASKGWVKLTVATVLDALKLPE